MPCPMPALAGLIGRFGDVYILLDVQLELAVAERVEIIPVMSDDVEMDIVRVLKPDVVIAAESEDIRKPVVGRIEDKDLAVEAELMASIGEKS